MGAETPKDIDRAAIAEQVQRRVEQAALRKMRKALDEIDEAGAAMRRTLRYVLMACVLLAVLGAWFFWGLVFSGRDLPKQTPMKVPTTVQQKQ